jgi:signal transduction histidine kinase
MARDSAVVAELYGDALPRGQGAGAGSELSELAHILAGADVGLALFDQQLRLLACNPLYQTLCGYQLQETATGARFVDLMRISLRRQKVAEAEIEKTVESVLSRLEPGTAYSFRYTSPSARVVEVRRRRLANGSLVETVREIETTPAGTDDNGRFAQIAEAARARMTHALDVMGEGFALYDARDRLVVYNRKFLDYNPHISDIVMPGASYEEMLRQGISRGGYVLNGTSPDDFLALQLQRHRNPGEPHELQLADGSWILVKEKRTDDGGTVGTCSDITEMKQREAEMLRISRELHAKNIQFDTALNNMIQGLCMIDREQRLIVCNRRYLELYGFSADVVKPGIKLREILEYSVSLGNYTEQEATRALAERPDPARLSRRVTIKQRLKDGRVIAVMNEPMPNGGSIATFQDITDIEHHDEQMRDHALKLERSNRELQDFAYVASHDLQEPLRKIEAFSDRLMRKYGATLPEDGQMYIERMQNASSRMRQLINDLLAYSRITSKANPFTAADLKRILSEVLSDLQIRIEETKAEVRAEELPTIEADPTQMRQLFQNIISNALKFRKKDVAPIIEIGGHMVNAPHFDGVKSTLVLTIADNGIGFENQYKDQIFTIFQRLHGRLEYEGTGIGLATCRRIVERHGGEIDAEGQLGKGATFTIILPISQSEGSETQ